MKKKIIKNVLFITTLSLMISFSATAQKSEILSPGEIAPEGTVLYSLPNTALHLKVEAVRESYTPGPYAKFSEKYLGIVVSPDKKDSYKLLSVKMTPFIEADQSKRIAVNLNGLSKNGSPINIYKFSSQGLIILSDQNKGGTDYWRFPTLSDNQSNMTEATNNFTSTETTLYKNVKNSSGGYDKVAIQQSQVVEKSIEKKAQEAANNIFNIRKKRVDIITGDTDATFSGEAMKAVIDELNKLEADYMSLFIGTTESAVQMMDFDVVPESQKEKQLYIAFRISDTQGLLLSDNVSGRPIVMEIIPEITAPTEFVDSDTNKKSRSKYEAKTRGGIYYRIPVICHIKLLDGQDLLLQSRVPVYQLGETINFPMDVLLN